MVLQVAGVRRRAGRAQPEVGRDRVDGRRHRLAVGQVDLVAVAQPQLPLHLVEGVAYAAGRGVVGASGRTGARGRAYDPVGVVHEQGVAAPASTPRRAPRCRCGPAGPGGRRSRSSRPSSRPGHLRRGPARSASTANGSSPTTSAPPCWCRVTCSRRRVVGQRHVLVAQEAQDRPAPRPRPRPAAVEPEHPLVRGRPGRRTGRPGRRSCPLQEVPDQAPRRAG